MAADHEVTPYIVLISAFVPPIMYIVYVLAFYSRAKMHLPLSHAAFLNENYSEIIDTLEPYSPSTMPHVVKYELAQSYVAVEPLQDKPGGGG